MTAAAPPLHLTATRVAEFFRYACERQLRFDLVPPEFRGGDVPETNRDPSRGPLVGPRAGSELLLRAGQRWERRKLRQVVSRFGGERVLAQGWTPHGTAERLPASAVVAALREPGTIEWLVQPELRLADPARFADRFGWDPALVSLAPAAPDLIRIRRGRNGRIRFQVIDIKASQGARLAHCAQVAFYTLLLEEICASEQVGSGSPDTRWGRIWARGVNGPVRFELGAYRHHVERFLREDLPRIARSAPRDAAWHLAARCGGCRYFEYCHAEAERTDDLARVPGITAAAKQILHAKGIRSARALADNLRRDTYTGCHALESQAGRLKQRAQALRYRKVLDVSGTTHLMGPHEDVRIILTAEGDPVTGLCFAVGVRVDVASGEAAAAETPVQVFVAQAGTRSAEREMLSQLLERLGAVLRFSSAIAPSRGGRAASLHIYLYDRAELELLRGLLGRHLSEAQTQPALLRLLRVLMPGQGDGGPAPRASPGTVLADVVAALFALPVPYAYDLAPVSAQLAPATEPKVYAPPVHHRWPFSSQLSFERIHAAWHAASGPHALADDPGETIVAEIRSTVEAKLAAIDSVIRAVRERAARKDRLQLRPEPLPASADDPPLAHPALESLRLFTQIEAAAEALAIRTLHALPPEERARRFECIRGMEFVERRDDGALIFGFDPECRDAKFRPGDFSLLLTNDDGRSLLEAGRQIWKRRGLSVELVEYDLAAEPPRVVLAPGPGFEKAEAQGWIDLGRRCVLDRAPADYNTPRVISTLRHLDAGCGEARLVLDLLAGSAPGGVQWQPGTADGVLEHTLGCAERSAGRPILNPGQLAAWRGVFENRTTLVWGPPGTGKTYLLAWMLIGLAAAARREGRPCRILVAAATHRAIVNVLARTAAELASAGIEPPLRLFKLKGSGSDADRELEGSAAELIPDDQLAPTLAGCDQEGCPVVAGATVWSLWKQMKAAKGGGRADCADAPVQPWFDVVVIDEASQMKVPESLIAMSSLRAGGQVILCGDDKQLAPVIRGKYPADAGSLFGSVFAHFSDRYPRFALRESRRMNGALVQYPRKLFYPGLVSVCPGQRLQLADGEPGDETDRQWRTAFLDPSEAVLFCTYAGVTATARNRFEAQIVARLARIARDAMIDSTTGTRYTAERFASHGLAIISPHRAQNSAIYTEMLAAGFCRDHLPVADTVERMQGNERELIIVSYAVADREYAEREAEFLLNPNRFNVSITRARSKLVVLMSEAVLDTLPQDERVLAGSMAIKGYADHCRDAVRVMPLPGPDGALVQVTCRSRTLSD